MSNDEQVTIRVNDESLEIMQCTSTAPTQESEVCESDVEFGDDSINSEFVVVDRNNDGFSHIRFADGSEAYVGEGLYHDEIMAEKAYFDNRIMITSKKTR